MKPEPRVVWTGTWTVGGNPAWDVRVVVSAGGGMARAEKLCSGWFGNKVWKRMDDYAVDILAMAVADLSEGKSHGCPSGVLQ